jgi:hypothetical protein
VSKHLGKVFAKQIIALKKPTHLEYVDTKDIKCNNTIRAKARYLFWACFRGHVNLVQHILDNDKISPFARVYEGRSPMMAALLGKEAPLKNQNVGGQDEKLFSVLITNRAQIQICCREYFYDKDPEKLEN